MTTDGLTARQRYHRDNPQKCRAHNAVYRAVKAGRLPRVSTLECSDCGAQAQEYHHHRGYAEEHKLDVIPLCKSCHRIADKLNLDGRNEYLASLRMANDELQFARLDNTDPTTAPELLYTFEGPRDQLSYEDARQLLSDTRPPLPAVQPCRPTLSYAEARRQLADTQEGDPQ